MREQGASTPAGEWLVPEGAADVFIGLGANLGDLFATLRSALQDLAAEPGVTLLAVSPAYHSAPVEATGPEYLNAVACLRTHLTPLQLLDTLQRIERAHGRERPYQNAPRTLDLDLLLFGQAVMHHERLVLPHPRLHLRAFVLQPLLDLAPALRLPQLGDLQPHLAAITDQPIRRCKEQL